MPIVGDAGAHVNVERAAAGGCYDGPDVKALIKVGYGCNENCTFCHTADVRHMEDTAERVEWKIDRAKRLGYSMVVLSGGEPTIRPELLRWAKRVAAHGLDFGLVTNGLLLSYPHVVDELVEEHRLRYVYMSLHGGSAKVHRSVVRADSFDKAIAALGQLHGRVPDLTVNCVVTTANVGHLRGVVDRLAALPELCLKFSMTQPKGAANRAFDVIVPDVRECAAAIKDAIEHGLALPAPRPRFAHDGVPFCLLPGLEELYDDLKTHRFATMIEVDEDDFVPVEVVPYLKPVRGAPCWLGAAGGGHYMGYPVVSGSLARGGGVGRPRSNSYHFVPERDVARPPGAPCPIKTDGVSPYDRARTLFLRLRDRMRLFRTATRDFSDVELHAAKLELGQVYLDVSRKLAPDDFAKDLRQLRLTAECRACEKHGECTGAWEPSPVEVFGRDDARVRELVAGLSGRVLDLGCGEGPYLELLVGRAATGAIEYVGVDPDEGRLAVLRARYAAVLASATAGGSARFVAAGAEELGPELGSFDHVLVLRSYNHLVDPEKALGGALARLSPGGTLTLVDNVAFGLVRDRAQAARAEAAPENRFEHYRNDGAGEAARRLDALAHAARAGGRRLELLERRDVERGSSNQWLLRFAVRGAEATA